MRLKYKRICFRTKGNHKQGMGDLTGSIALSMEFKNAGHGVYFVIDDDAEAVSLLNKRGIDFTEVHGSERRAWRNRYFDIAIVNQLTTTFSVMSIIREYCRKLVTIDDKGEASRAMADLRVNPLYYDEGACCDFSYVPLDGAFAKVRVKEKCINDNIARILVTMGGSDTYGFTPQVLSALSGFPDEVEIAVVLGQAFKHDKDLRGLLSKTNRKFNLRRSIDAKEMFRLMRWADIAICGGGNTVFEMARCGTPAIIVSCEPFEEETAYRMEKMGFGKAIPFGKKPDLSRLKELLREFNDKKVRDAHSRAGMKLVDGMGANRIAKLVLEKCG